MKVKIGPYKNWIGPYQIADKIPFLSEDARHNVGEWLASTWVLQACEKFDKFRGERKIDVRIDEYDTWSMDSTLALIILPMLKQLRDNKIGSQIVDEEDVPPHMRHSNPDPEYNGADNWVHYKWEWILNEMIWAFENVVDDSWQYKFYHGESVHEWNLVSGTEGEEDALYEMKQLNPDFWIDTNGLKEYNDRIDNGLRLFGKYYRGLWD